MRVGIDARLLSEPNNGIGRYTSELIGELVNKPGQFHLYSARQVAAEKFHQKNVMVRSANINRRVSKMLWSQTCLPHLAAKDEVDVFWGATHRLPSLLSEKIACVVTIHDLVWKHASETMRPLSRWMDKRLMPKAIRRADRVVADSISTANDIELEFPSARDKIRVVYPGVTDLPTPLEFKSLGSLGVNSPYFLFVGTLEPRKNLQRLLEAYSLLNAETRNRAQLVIAGLQGWGDSNLVGSIKSLGLNEQVILTGQVNDVWLSTLYSHARFLVMPSLYEGFGLPIVEAMSYGVPVLTSNLSSLPEVAGDAGVLVDPLDIYSIAQGLSSLLSDDAYRDYLASLAIPNSKRFSWHSTARELWDVFAEAAEARSELRKYAGR